MSWTQNGTFRLKGVNALPSYKTWIFLPYLEKVKTGVCNTSVWSVTYSNACIAKAEVKMTRRCDKCASAKLSSILSIILEETRKCIHKDNLGLLLLLCVWLQLHSITVSLGNNKRGSSSCWCKFLCRTLYMTVLCGNYI